MTTSPSHGMYAAAPVMAAHGNSHNHPTTNPYVASSMPVGGNGGTGTNTANITGSTTNAGVAVGTTNATSTMANVKFDMNDIVMHFGREYYTNLCCHPERLFNFYGKHSSLLHCFEEDMDAAVCVGLEEINERIMSMNYGGTRVVIGNIDCQPTMNGGILIFVLGSMLWNNGRTNKFSQTFILAEQPNGYFVLNDIMRILNGTIASFPASSRSQTTTMTTETPAVNNSAIIQPPSITADVPGKNLKASANTTTTTTTATLSTSSLAKTFPPTLHEVVKQQSIPNPSSTKENTASNTVDKQSSGKAVTKKTTTPVVEVQKMVEKSTPSSWASLAAGQQNRWQSGVVADAKGPIATISVQGTPEEPSRSLSSNGGRVTYRTSSNGNNEHQQQQQSRHSAARSRSRQELESTKAPASPPLSPTLEENGARQNRNTTRDRDQVRRFEYDPSKSIYVSHMKGDVKRDIVRKLFESFGEIKHLECIPSKGIAFIEFAAITAQQAALAGEAALTINDQPLRVEPRRATVLSPKGQSSNNNSKADRTSK